MGEIGFVVGGYRCDSGRVRAQTWTVSPAIRSHIAGFMGSGGVGSAGGVVFQLHKGEIY